MGRFSKIRALVCFQPMQYCLLEVSPLLLYSAPIFSFFFSSFLFSFLYFSLLCFLPNALPPFFSLSFFSPVFLNSLISFSVHPSFLSLPGAKIAFVHFSLLRLDRGKDKKVENCNISRGAENMWGRVTYFSVSF